MLLKIIKVLIIVRSSVVMIRLRLKRTSQAIGRVWSS